MNPPLHFSDEPCRHKILDLIGDLSLFAQFGNQGLPVAHIVAYKACAFGSVFPIFNILICQFDFHCVKMMYFVQPNLFNSSLLKYLNWLFVDFIWSKTCYSCSTILFPDLNYAQDLRWAWFLMQLIYPWCRVAMHCILIWHAAW